MLIEQITRQFEALHALVDQIQAAYKRGDLTAQQATYLIHFDVDVDQRRNKLVKVVNTLG